MRNCFNRPTKNKSIRAIYEYRLKIVNYDKNKIHVSG